eukprot:1161304-Pelagomonas_calceolata.AAC.2
MAQACSLQDAWEPSPAPIMGGKEAKPEARAVRPVPIKASHIIVCKPVGVHYFAYAYIRVLIRETTPKSVGNRRHCELASQLALLAIFELKLIHNEEAANMMIEACTKT